MSVKLGQNINSLKAHSSLARVSSDLSRTYERLSSGQRINHASDDAAGIAIATSLNMQSRVFSQGLRNINDGISLLRIAEGALSELNSISIRQKELAEQSANGVFSTKQRQAINTEAQALTNEYNRIAVATKFNGISILNRSSSDGIRFQAGYGVSGGIEVGIGLGSITTSNVGDGTFGAASTYALNSGGTVSFGNATGDINGDGVLDIISGAYHDSTIRVLIGNGDGTFAAQQTYSAAGGTFAVMLNDFNEDGKLDLVYATSGSGNGVYLRLGNGDGTFGADNMIGTTADSRQLQAADLNGDDHLDIGFADQSDGLKIYIGHGNGSFDGEVSYGGSNAHSLIFADMNGDSYLDAVMAGIGGELGVALGVGDGTFGSTTYITPASGSRFLDVGDINGDGKLDVISTDYNSGEAVILIGAGDGTFSSSSNLFLQNNIRNVYLRDLNGDDKLDLISSSSSDPAFTVSLGNGNGTFASSVSYGIPGLTYFSNIADLNGDGVLDLISSGGNGPLAILLGDTDGSTTGISALVDDIDLSTQSSGRSTLQSLSTRLDFISRQLGEIGAAQSRFSVALGALAVSVDNSLAAASRIQDVDIAEESSRLARLSILQQVGASVLAQSSLSPQLALKLLVG